MNRTSLLNFLIDRYQYNSYLEIGVGLDADNYEKIDIPDKIGIDPESSKSPIKLSSDEFFEINNRKFDLIFIDGFHSQEQAYKDFENSYICLNPGGCIVLHDCLPNEEVEQGPPRPGVWTGDVWKAFVKIRQLKFVESFTMDSDWGLGIVFNIPNTQVLEKSQTPTLNWDAYASDRNRLLRIIKPNQLLDFLPEPQNKKRIKSTTIAEWGRIGHQFHDILSGMVIAELFGFDYYYSGFHNDHFHVNEYLNFGDFLPNVDYDSDCTIEMYTPDNKDKWEGMSIEFMRKHLRQIPPNTNIIFKYSTYYSILALLGAEKHQGIALGLHDRVLNKLRKIMPSTKLYSEFKSDFEQSDKVSVAMYVRAGGKLNDNAQYEQYRSEYDQVLDRVRQDHPGKELDIRVYTQGPLEEVKDFQDFKTIICEEEYPRLYEVIKTLITADVFVAGLSSFSSFISIFRSGPTYWHHRNIFGLSFDIIV